MNLRSIAKYVLTNNVLESTDMAPWHCGGNVAAIRLSASEGDRKEGSQLQISAISCPTNSNVWLDNEGKTNKGHIFTCALLFKGNKVWGPVSCHDNTIELKDALNKADNRLDLELKKKDHTLEGHTRYISVKAHGKLYLDKLSTHENMQGLVAAVDAIVALDD